MSELFQGQQPEQVLEVRKAMQKQDMVPNAITYSALISTCDTCQQPEQALELRKAMQRQGMVPNVIIYSRLISTCEKGKRP